MEMTPLNISLVVLVVAGVWALVELALTLRQGRKSVGEVCDTLNETIAEIKPVVQKLDGVADELAPATKELQPLLDKAGTAVDALTVDLVRVDDILSDVSSVTGAGANVTDAVTKVTASAADGIAGVVGKLGVHAPKASRQAKLGHADPAAIPAGDETAPQADEPAAKPAEHAGGRSYFTYPDGDTADKSAE